MIYIYITILPFKKTTPHNQPEIPKENHLVHPARNGAGCCSMFGSHGHASLAWTVTNSFAVHRAVMDESGWIEGLRKNGCMHWCWWRFCWDEDGASDFTELFHPWQLPLVSWSLIPLILPFDSLYFFGGVEKQHCCSDEFQKMFGWFLLDHLEPSSTWPHVFLVGFQ